MPRSTLKHGIPPAPPGLSIAERLARYVTIDPVSGCHIWQGSLNSNGYPQLNVDRRPQLGHRLAWVARHGPIPAGLVVCHACDERRCINPEHHFLESQHGNMADYRRKRRLRIARAAAPGGLPADAAPHEIAPIRFIWRGFEWTGEAVMRPFGRDAAVAAVPDALRRPARARSRRR